MPDKNKKIHNLEQMLKKIEELSKNKKQITLESILEKVGRRSFGPILLGSVDNSSHHPTYRGLSAVSRDPFDAADKPRHVGGSSR